MVNLEHKSSQPFAVAPSSGRLLRFLRLSPFWTLLWLIVLVSAIFRLLVFARGLPYITEIDEPNIYYTIQGWRGLFNGDIYQGYPPIILLISFAVQLVTEALGHPGIASTVYVMRLLAVGYSLGTLIVISLLARRIAGDVAALVAGASWGISALIVQYSINAQADPLAFLIVTSSVFLAVVAVQDPARRHWCVYSFVLGLLAVLTKYPLFPVLLPPGLIALYVLLREDRARGLRFLAIQVVLTGLVLFWMFAIYRVQNLTVQAPGLWASFQAGLSLRLLPTFVDNFDHALRPIDPLAVLSVWLLGCIAYALAARLNRARVQIIPVLLILFTAVLLNVVSSLMAQDYQARWRDVLPPAPLICILFGVAVWQIVQVLPAPSSRLAFLLWRLPILVGLGLVWVQQVINTVDYVQVSRLQPVQVTVRQWAQVNLEPGWVIVNRGHVRTFNTFFGGIPGSKWFPWWDTNALAEHTIDEWRRMNMQYAALEEQRVRELEQTADGRAYLSKLLLLRAFPGMPVHQGPATRFYRLWRPQIETQFTFTDSTAAPPIQIALVGYDLTPRSRNAVGGSLSTSPDEYQFTFYWKALSTPSLNYSVFVHLRPLNDTGIAAQIDDSLGITERPTSTWDDRSETIIGRPLSLRVPNDLPPGQYKVMVGLYDSTTGQRLTTADGQSEIELTRFTINPTGAVATAPK